MLNLWGTECQECYGNKACVKCDGTGEEQGLSIGTFAADLVGEDPPECGHCNGTGKCPNCDGTGEVEAEEQD